MSDYREKLAAIHPNLGEAARHGARLDHPSLFVHPNPKAHRSRFVSASMAGTGALERVRGSSPSPHKVDEYLGRMPAMSGVVRGATENGPLPLDGVSIFLIHHLTAEVLGTLSAVRALGCRDLTVLFVGYNEDAEKAYRPDLDDLPDDEVRCFILKSSTASGGEAEGTYSVARGFTKAPEGDRIPYDALDQTMSQNKMDFLRAMRALAITLSLQQLARAKQSGCRCLLIEDGGYMTPILNEAALEGKTLEDLCEAHRSPGYPSAQQQLGSDLRSALDALMIGTVEHTRNGYDRDARINLKYGELAIPCFTIAVSYQKTQVESDIVASSILNAVTSVLYSHGYVLKRRNVLVFGSRGNIGRRMMSHLVDRVADPREKLIGCDLKVGSKGPAEKIPDWQTDPGTSSVPECVEKATYAEFDAERVKDLDLIIGITGGPTPDHPVLRVEDVVAWLLEGNRRDLYLASGSSKTDEYPEILKWMDGLLSSSAEGAVETEIGGRPARLEKRGLEDAVSGRSFGSEYVFNIRSESGDARVRSLIFLNELMPVNFLFYGVATEVIDEVLSQILSAAITLCREAESLPKSRLYAVDFDRVASVDVYASRPPAADLPQPLPS